MRTAPLLLVAAIMTLSRPAYADEASVMQGQALAEHWCVSCHVIGPDMPGGDAGPTFRSIAGRFAHSTRLIGAWLADPHPPMPKLDLTHAEIRAISDYIVSLSP